VEWGFGDIGHGPQAHCAVLGLGGDPAAGRFDDHLGDVALVVAEQEVGLLPGDRPYTHVPASVCSHGHRALTVQGHAPNPETVGGESGGGTRVEVEEGRGFQRILGQSAFSARVEHQQPAAVSACGKDARIAFDERLMIACLQIPGLHALPVAGQQPSVFGKAEVERKLAVGYGPHREPLFARRTTACRWSCKHIVHSE